MKISRGFRTCAAAVLLLTCYLPVRATTIEKMSLARLTHVAPIIVHARCASNATAWEAGEIWTFTTFDVLDSWKFPSQTQIPPQIIVRLLGGTVGPLTSNVSGVPRFRPGEEVVLFLEPTSRGDLSIVSWQQGTFRIYRDPRSAVETVTQDTAAFAVFDPRTRRFEANGVRNLPLSSFRQQVDAAIATHARVPDGQASTVPESHARLEDGPVPSVPNSRARLADGQASSVSNNRGGK